VKVIVLGRVKISDIQRRIFGGGRSGLVIANIRRLGALVTR
jgi:hypothetical protein